MSSPPVILYGSGSALPVPPPKTEEIPVLMLGCCPSMTLSITPCVMAHLLHDLEIMLGHTISLQWHIDTSHPICLKLCVCVQ